jgi:hypothetical protein
MGRSTKTKVAKAEAEKAAWQNQLTQINQQAKQKAEIPEEPLINRILYFREFFIRDEKSFILKTKSSDRFKQTLELVRHVFQKYQTPSFMNYIWNTETKFQNGGGHYNRNRQQVTTRPFRRNFEHELWFVCVATGGSLHKEYFKEFFTKRETHTFLNCKHDLTIPEALVYAVCKADGASEGSALRVARTKLVEKKLNEFWKHAMRFFAKEEKITISEINDLVDYLDNRRRENEVQRIEGPKGQYTLIPRPKFELAGSGYTVASLFKKMKDWHYDLRRFKEMGEASWEGRDLEDSFFTLKTPNNKDTRWSFRQIKTAKALQQEGNAQRHCVYGYKDRCIRGDVSIWSLLQVEDEYGVPMERRKLTIEVTKDGVIVQARGVANRPATNGELTLLSSWASKNGLYMSYLYR